MVKKLSFLLIILWFFVISLIYLHATDAFDQDLGRHLKLGEIIWQTRQIPKTNLFSYTNPNEPVFNSHWGSQVIFYLIHKNLGTSGLILLNTFFNTLAFSLIFLLTWRRTGPLISGALFIPFLFLLSDRTWIRPEMFSNLFFAILLLAIFSKKIRGVIKWVMPVLALLWINLHISALLGVFMIFSVLLQDSLEAKNKTKTILINVSIFIITLLALNLNPYGLAGILQASFILSKYGYTIVENQSWFFLKDFGFPLVLHIFSASLILVTSFFLTKRKPVFAEILILLAITILTFRFTRNETYFAYAAFLTTALNLASSRLEFKEYFAPFARFSLVLSLVLVLMSFILILGLQNKRGLAVGFGNKESYKRDVDFFVQNNLPSPIFNNFDIGGYLIYRLYPATPVFVDNRPEAYPVDFFQKVYIPTQENPKVFEKVVSDYGIKTIIWGFNDITPWSKAFLVSLRKNTDWKEVYRDEVLGIWKNY